MTSHEELMAAVKATREFRAGQAFDVPGDAVEKFTAAVIAAVEPLIRRDERTKTAADIAQGALEVRIGAIGTTGAEWPDGYDAALAFIREECRRIGGDPS